MIFFNFAIITKILDMKTLNILSLTLVFSLFVACSETNNTNEQISTQNIKNTESAQDINIEYDGPIISFENESHDFGDIQQGETVSTYFKFKNTGKKELVISTVKTSCGCTVPKYPKTPIQPGDEESIEVVFDSSGKKGFTNKTITIVSNCQPSTQTVKITANIILPNE